MRLAPRRLLLFAMLALAIPAPVSGDAPNVRAALQALSVAPDAERPERRWRLAQDYAAAGLHAEADGVLGVLAADSPHRADTSEFRLLRAEVLIALGAPATALAELDTSTLAEVPAACLQRLAASARLRDHAGVAAAHRCAAPALAALPATARAPYLMAAVRTYAEAGAMAAAAAVLRRMDGLSPVQQGEAEYWRGVTLRGDAPAALAHFRRAAAGPNPIAALRAEVAATEIEVAAGHLTPKAALARLEGLDNVWRGGAAERDLLMALGSLRDATGDVSGAFAAWSAVAGGVPDLSKRFSAAIADAPPDQAVALLGAYPDYAPQGAEADALIRRLSERLAAAGRIAEAARLLDHQVAHRLEGTARASVAVRLADLLVASGNPERALTVLAETRAALPADLDLRRRQAEAAARIRTGGAAEARALLAGIDGRHADILRAEAAWVLEDWPAVIAGLEPLLPEGAATAQDAGLILRVAVAAARQGDRERLRSLERRYRTMRGQAARALEALVDAPRDPRVLAAVTETVSTYSVIEGSAA
jgi:tetratricopeptide (TPR) repeat protein